MVSLFIRSHAIQTQYRLEINTSKNLTVDSRRQNDDRNKKTKISKKIYFN